MNEDVRATKLQDMFWSVGSTDRPTAKHLHLPATHNQGSAPIDGIFVLITLLKHCNTGYLDLGDAVPSDHRAMWLDIPTQCICPIDQETIMQSPAWWLQCKDPWVINKNNQILWELLHKNGIATQDRLLQHKAKHHLLQSQQIEYEVIDWAAIEYKHHV